MDDNILYLRCSSVKGVADVKYNITRDIWRWKLPSQTVYAPMPYHKFREVRESDEFVKAMRKIKLRNYTG